MDYTMKKNIVIIIIVGINILLSYSGLAFDLSGTILDENGRPSSNHTLLLSRQETIDEMSQSLDPTGDFPTDIDMELVGEGWSCKSDELGHFTFTNLQNGIYDIVVYGRDYPLSKQTEEDYDYGGRHIELSSESITNIILTPVPIEYFSIHGEIWCLEADSPVRAEVGIAPSLSTAGKYMSRPEVMMNFMKNVNSDGNGIFVKQNAPVGDYTIDVFINRQSNNSIRLAADFSLTQNGGVVINDMGLRRLTDHNVKLKLWTTKQTSIQEYEGGAR